MVNFDNFGGLTSVLKFHIFLIFTVKNWYVSCNLRRTGSIFSDINNWYSIFTNAKNRYQFLTYVMNWFSIFTNVKNQYQILTYVKNGTKYSHM